MKKVFAFLALAVTCALAFPFGLVSAQRAGLNPSHRASDASAPDSNDDRFIIKFRQFGKFASDDVRARGGQVVRELPELAAVAARLPEHARAALANNPNVEFIEVDPRRYPMQTGTWSDLPIAGTNETTPYGIQMVQADQVSDQFAANRKVCIIDSGYKDAHEDLMDRTSGHVTASTNAGTGDPYRDYDSHGTHVAGTIAGLRNGTGVVGVLPGGNVNLHIVKVFGDDGAWTYSSDLAGAVTQCRDAGANVISMSLGGLGGSTIEQTAFQNSYNAGVLSIAAAGNDGNTATNYPAGYASVVSVAAVDNTEAHASFSNVNADVEIAAPGVATLSSLAYKDTQTLNVNGTTYTGNHVEYAASSNTSGVTATLVGGGLCDTTGGGAWAGKVVLCERGTISFYDKVHNVQLGGGAAAVIYNNLAEPLYATLGEGNSSTIPAIGLTQADGQAALAQAGSAATVASFEDQTFNNVYAPMNGTSMATPHVSGVAALVWSYNTSWTNAQIRNALTATARDKGTAGRDTTFGYGIVQAKAALDYLNAPPSGPAAPSGLVVTATGNNYADLAWADNSGNETGFKIERCTGSTCTNFTQIGTVAANSTSARNSGLSRRTTYRFRIRAYNAVGDSAYSNVANGTTR